MYHVELIISIDVGLKNGIKKKLYVYEGDKSEELAKKFAAENSKCYIYIIMLYIDLDNNKQTKLNFLIQKEISKYHSNLSSKN